MPYIHRLVEKSIAEHLKRGKSILLLGARQTGKTTLLKQQCQADLFYTFLDPETRLRFEKSPQILQQEITAFKHLKKITHLPLVILDEIQKIPAIMDVLQLMIDNHEAQFILTGSSARKLKRDHNINLLPGRVVKIQLDPLCLLEMPKPWPDVQELLLYGSLPQVYQTAKKHLKETDLESYVSLYLNEEVRAEALVRQLGAFVRFLEFSATESGKQINMSKLSQDIGVSRHAIAEYYEILEDCLVANRIEPITKTTTRRRLTKSPKYLLFDMGIRRIAAGEGSRLPAKILGELFEQFIGLELLRYIRLFLPIAKLRYWRDHSGPEIDYVIEINHQYLPLETKWTKTPTPEDAKHLLKFMDEYDSLKPGYIVCRTSKPLMLHKDVIAISWEDLPDTIKSVLNEGR
jgi:predicted AAA+ superfamily ATPase